ncbi:MAG: M23 family metallopeptidase [Bacteroidota bacterium]
MRFRGLLMLLGGLLSIAFTGDEARNYPTDYFRAPVNYQMKLSGTFGELRPNHFHAGIDIKGKVGAKLYAIGDGYISRIKVQEGGYGNVLYINHPNGYTSVYAHLHRFTPEVADYVKQAQYNAQTFEIELYPPKDLFAFAKGDEIGKMGVSGRSFGPHLHFEIRDTKTEEPINPLLFGLKVADSRRPKLHQLKLFGLSKYMETTSTKTLSVYGKGKTYSVKGDTTYVKAPQVGVALKAYDHMDEVRNWNGIYSLSLFLDDSLHYQFEMERFAFSESRYINAHLDYEEQVTKKSYFNRCFLLPGNELSIYNYLVDRGVINLNQERARKVELVAKDIEGNEAKLRFWVKQHSKPPPTAATTNHTYFLPYQEKSIIELPNLKAFFPEGTLYENLYMSYNSAEDQSNGIYSAVHHIHDYKTPAHKYFTLSLLPSTLPLSLKDKAFVAYCGKNNKVINYGGEWEGEWLKTKVRDFGDFYISVDDKAPKIVPLNFKKNLKGRKRVSFKITDNIATARNVAGLQYRATIDGQWVLLQFDAKNDLLTHTFESDLTSGEHQLRLEVWDALNNKAVFERSFVR